MKQQIALVGTGGISQSHLKGWAEQPDAEVVLVCDVNEELARSRVEQFELDAEVVTDLADVLGSDCPMVDLCTPSFLHAEQSIACLQAGKHVMCEKPMANTLAEAEAIAAAAAAHPEVVYLCEHRMLFDPLVVVAREHLSELGKPFYFRQRSAHALTISESIRKVGAFLDIGYHPLYTALHFLGPADHAFALCKQLVRSEMANDNGWYVLEHEGGVSVVEGSFSSIGPMGGCRPFELYGEQGSLIGGWMPNAHLTLYTGNQGDKKPAAGVPLEVPAGSWIANAVRHFLDVVAGQVEPLSGAADALATMQTYDAALKSIESGAKEPVQTS